MHPDLETLVDLHRADVELRRFDSELLALPQKKATIEARIAKPLGVSIERAAAGIIRLMDQKLLQAVQRLSSERGHDPRPLVSRLPATGEPDSRADAGDKETDSRNHGEGTLPHDDKRYHLWG